MRRLRFTGLILVLADLLLVVATVAYARGTVAPETTSIQRRVALVIGNSKYRNVTPLVNPSHDSHLVAKTLRSLGFTLIGGREQNDLDKSGFDRAIENFGDQIRGADVALFYYAGHGVQVRGSNYLVPIDANPTRESDVDFQFVDSETVVHQMEDAKAQLNLIILDACRNNPFGGRGLRAVAAGLAEMRAPDGTLISYATQPGSVASDGDKGDSPFTLALVHEIQQPGDDIFRVFNQIGLVVERESGGAQQPWVAASPIKGDFYFAGAAPSVPNTASTVPDPDVVFWQSIESSHDAADYQAYLKEFPDGRFAPLAHSRIAKYQHVTSPTDNSSTTLAMPSTPNASVGQQVAQHALRVTPTSERTPSEQSTPTAIEQYAAEATPTSKHVPRKPTTALPIEQYPAQAISTSNRQRAKAQPLQLASAEVPESSEAMGAALKGRLIVVGDPLDKADADLMVKRFERFGYHPSLNVSTREPGRYSLSFGPYSPGQAHRSRRDLLRHWHDLTFHLIVSSRTGPLMDEAAASNTVQVMRSLGANAVSITQNVSGQTQYQVEVGPFVTQDEAIAAGEQLSDTYTRSLHCPWGDCDWQYTWRGSPPRLLCSSSYSMCSPDQ
ncbi:MAG: caspase family protein [Deltaproteobacteria bacterium]|nr:caspase family protein [Deltaproteobacteria bacterium]